MNESKQGRGRPRKQQEEHSVSGGRMTRSAKHSEDQNQEQKGLSEISTSVADKKKDLDSVETRTSGQELMQKDFSEGSAVTEDRKKSKEFVVETRHNTRRSGTVSADKHQESQRSAHKQQKVLTEYFQPIPSQSETSKSKLKQQFCKNGSDSSCHDNKGDKGQASKVQTPRTRSGRKVSESKNKDEETGKKSYEREKEVPRKGNQRIETTRGRRGRPTKMQKNPGISEGLTQKTPIKELLKESPGLQTRAGLSSSPSSSGQDLGRPKKDKKLTSAVVSSPVKTTSTIVKTPELSRSKKGSLKTPPTRSFCGSQREPRRTTPRKEGLNSTDVISHSKSDVKKISPALTRSKSNSPKTPVLKTPDNSHRQGVRRTPRLKPKGTEVPSPLQDIKSDVKKNSQVLTQSKTNSPKTPDNSYRQGVHRTPTSKLQSTEVPSPSQDVKIKSPALTKSKTSSPETPDNSYNQGVHRTPRSKLQGLEVTSPSQDVKIKSPALTKSKTTSPKTPVLKPSNISPRKGIPKTPSKRGKVSSPAVSSPIRKMEKKITTPLVSRSSSQSPMTSTPSRSSQSAVRLLGSPRDQCLSVSRSSSASSSPVRRLRSREHADRYGEGCSGVGAGSSSLEDSEEFVVPSCSRQTMSPLTEDNDKGDDSSTSEYDVNDDEACITDAMKAEEYKIHQQTVKDENKEKIECMDEWATMQEGQKFDRLQHLLNKSNIYCQFLLKRMEEQREEEEKKQKRITKRQENKEIKEATKQQQVQRRSSRRKENDQVDSQGSTDSSQPEPAVKTKRGRKRKAEHSTSKLSDYITEEAIVKRQKINESKSPTRTPLRDRSPEQCVPITPKSASPKKGKANTVDGDVHTSQPSLMTGGVMRDYQIEGLEWLKVLYENGVNGILADEMGLGKTVQCIGLIAHLIEMGVKGPFLVAAPLSTLPNWVSEFHRFTPKVPVILYHGSIEERTVLRRKISKLITVGPYVSQPVIVTSYEICMNDQKHLYNYKWKHMIVDEGHRIKNLNCRLIRELKTYDSANRLLLTGTPLQNNLQELWSLLNFLLPDIFDDLSSFQRLFDFSAIGDEESKEKILAQEREHQVLKTLHSILTPFLLRRLKSDVELSLPPKKELLVYAPLTNKQTTFYKAALDKTIGNLVGPQKNKKEEIVEINSVGRPARKKKLNINYKVFDAQDFEELSNTLTEMRTAREPEMRTTNQQQQDSIVSVPLRNILMLLRKCCNHPYLLEYPLNPATQDFKIDEELVSCSGKMKILDQLLAGLRAKGHKVLVFSQMTKMLDILEDFCYLRKYSYCRLDGSMSVQDRREQMKDFTTDSNIFLFLLSTRAGGLGLNLSAADTVIIYDSDWNPQADLQAQDRCHRIGQTKPIIVYRLVTSNTVDEKMVERASSKRRLEKLVIHKGKFKGKLDDNVLSAEELSELLEAANHDQVITNDGLLLSKKQLDALLDRSDLIAQHKRKNRIVPDVDSTDSALFKVIDSSS